MTTADKLMKLGVIKKDAGFYRYCYRGEWRAVAFYFDEKSLMKHLKEYVSTMFKGY